MNTDTQALTAEPSSCLLPAVTHLWPGTALTVMLLFPKDSPPERLHHDSADTAGRSRPEREELPPEHGQQRNLRRGFAEVGRLPRRPDTSPGEGEATPTLHLGSSPRNSGTLSGQKPIPYKTDNPQGFSTFA